MAASKEYTPLIDQLDPDDEPIYGNLDVGTLFSLFSSTQDTCTLLYQLHTLMIQLVDLGKKITTAY